MGPFNAISKFCRQLKWAHPLLSAMSVGSCHGPIQCQQHCSPAAAMGPFRAIGNTMLHTHWAHPFILAILSMGPFVIYAYFTQWVHVGFSDLIDQIARGLFQSLRQISVSLCVATSLSDTLWLTTSHQKLSKSPYRT